MLPASSMRSSWRKFRIQLYERKKGEGIAYQGRELIIEPDMYTKFGKAQHCDMCMSIIENKMMLQSFRKEVANQ